MLKLHVIEGPRKGENFRFEGEVVFVGRSARNDIQILDDSISRKHLKIFKLEKSFFVKDLRLGQCEQPAFRKEDLLVLESLSGPLALALENEGLT